jgi:DNA-binding transcriptional LysR family regulator
MKDIDTALLRTFSVLAETRNFSATGNIIGRSQSAVSAQIKRLEDLFGCKLLLRDTRNVALTAQGERLLGKARQMLLATDALIAGIRGPDVAGNVRFGSPEDFATAYLPEVLGAFAAAHPKVALHVTCELTLPLIAAFRGGALDMIIIKQDPADRYPGATTLWQEDLVWILPEAAERDFGALRTRYAEEGRPLPLVLSPAPCVYRQRATRALDSAGLAWDCVYTSPSYAGSSAAVRAGIGFTLMPRGLVPAGAITAGPGDGWPTVEPAELALVASPQPGRATAALAAFVTGQVRPRTPGGY